MLAIDPGLSGTGWAYFSRTRLVRVGTLKAPLGDWDDRIPWYCEQVSTIARRNKCRSTIIELPMFMQSQGGMLSARSGALVKLSMLVGAMQFCLIDGGFVVRLITSTKWKGQLPKPIVEDRIRKTLGLERVNELRISTHGWDAVGIGLHHFGRF